MAEERKNIPRCDKCGAAYVDKKWIDLFTDEWKNKITFAWRILIFSDVLFCPDCCMKYEILSYWGVL